MLQLITTHLPETTNDTTADAAGDSAEEKDADEPKSEAAKK
jgi:hypothetical protein